MISVQIPPCSRFVLPPRSKSSLHLLEVSNGIPRLRHCANGWARRAARKQHRGYIVAQSALSRTAYLERPVIQDSAPEQQIRPWPSSGFKDLCTKHLELLFRTLARLGASNACARAVVYLRHPDSSGSGIVQLHRVAALQAKDVSGSGLEVQSVDCGGDGEGMGSSEEVVVLNLSAGDSEGGLSQEQYLIQEEVVVLPNSPTLVAPLAEDGTLLGLIIFERLHQHDTGHARDSVFDASLATEPFTDDEMWCLRTFAPTLARSCALEREAAATSAVARALGSARQQAQALLRDAKGSLATMNTYGSLLMPRLEDTQPDKDMLQGMLNQSKRLKEVVQQLQAAFHPVGLERARLGPVTTTNVLTAAAAAKLPGPVTSTSVGRWDLSSKTYLETLQLPGADSVLREPGTPSDTVPLSAETSFVASNAAGALPVDAGAGLVLGSILTQGTSGSSTVAASGNLPLLATMLDTSGPVIASKESPLSAIVDDASEPATAVGTGVGPADACRESSIHDQAGDAMVVATGKSPPIPVLPTLPADDSNTLTSPFASPIHQPPTTAAATTYPVTVSPAAKSATPAADVLFDANLATSSPAAGIAPLPALTPTTPAAELMSLHNLDQGAASCYLPDALSHMLSAARHRCQLQQIQFTVLSPLVLADHQPASTASVSGTTSAISSSVHATLLTDAQSNSVECASLIHGMHVLGEASQVSHAVACALDAVISCTSPQGCISVGVCRTVQGIRLDICQARSVPDIYPEDRDPAVVASMSAGRGLEHSGRLRERLLSTDSHQSMPASAVWNDVDDVVRGDTASDQWLHVRLADENEDRAAVDRTVSSAAVAVLHEPRSAGLGSSASTRFVTVSGLPGFVPDAVRAGLHATDLLVHKLGGTMLVSLLAYSEMAYGGGLAECHVRIWLPSSSDVTQVDSGSSSA